MNRKVSKILIWKAHMACDNIDTKLDNLVDKIYDGFESRTCENCKHYSLEDIWGNADDKYWTCLNQLPHATVVSYPPKDFGCNKWEAKCGEQ